MVGGALLNDPGSDLAVCIALASAALDKPVPADLAVLGEVGLGGEVRHVPHVERRVNEAVRMGFRRVILPSNARVEDVGRASLVRAATLADALSAAFQD